MLTLIIVILLLIGFYTGVRRGLVLQLAHIIGYIVSFFFAKEYYLTVAEYLEMLIPYPQPGPGEKMLFYNEIQILNLDMAFYNAIAFLLLLATGWLITRILGSMLNSLTFVPLVREVNALGGGIGGFVMQYAGIFFLLTFLSLIPLDFLQGLLAESGLAQWIITNTPYLSRAIYEWWLGVLG